MSWDLIFKQGALARELRRSDVLVLFAIADCLDFVEPRPLKTVVAARLSGVAESTASGALRRLSATGFLVKSPGSGPTRRYRLPVSREASKVVASAGRD